MNNRNRVIWCMMLAGLTLCIHLNFVACSNAQSSQTVDKSELAKNLIVKITGDNVSGSGIVFGQLRDMLFIATANHVVRRGAKEAQNLRVAFNFWFEEIEVKLLRKFDKDLDLAVLLVKLEESDLSSDALKEFLPLTQLQYVSDVKAGNKLYPVGHPAGRDWYVPTSPKNIFDVEGERILIEFECNQGFSGGGIFDEQWDLAGMIRAFNPPLCEAISFARIQDILEKWRFIVSLKAAPDSFPALTTTPAPVPTVTPTSQPKPVAGQEKHDPVSGIDFVWVPEGCFQMGQSEADKRYIIQERGEEKYKKYYMDELPRHEVCVDGFWMGETEVTQSRWTRIMGNNPSSFQGETRPVDRVSWNDVQEFLQKLNGQAERDIYRLPTEAEWEYAARAGTDTMFYFGDDAGKLGDYAWYTSNSGGETHPVRQLKPNVWGLYDMHGNVWEWCQDWYDSEYYSKSLKENPQGPSSGGSRVRCGGSWRNNPDYCRSANRGRSTPDLRKNNYGFRVVTGSGAWTLQ